MALAFQDCCNTNNYFQVENIPGPIYEGSYYYVLTTNGLQFCGVYIELPTDLGYNPPSYNVQTLTKYTNCAGCQSAKNLTCVETVNVIFQSLPGGSNVTVSECECETIKVMTSFCNTQSITPGNNSAPLSIGIQGGTAPYKVYNNETNSLLISQTSPSDNIVINSQAPEGTYSLRVEDSYSDFVQYLNCVINIPPAPLDITCLPTAPTIFGANNGRIQLNINGGVQPYTITFEGTASTVNGTIKLYQNLTADTYTYSIIDSGVGSEQQQLGPFNCTVVPGPQINYPTNLCVSIPVCGTNYLLSFSWDGTTRQNYRPVYVCSNPSLVGAQQIQIYFNTTQGWITDAYNIGQFQIPQGCTSITNQFKIKQQTVNTSVSSQPTGNWVVPSPLYSFNGSTINVTGSQCVNAPIVVAPIQNSVICGSNSPSVSKTITVTSGNGPFTYYRNGSLIPSPTFNVGPGTYSYYVRGLNNTQSQPQSFTVTSQNPTLLSYGSNCNYTIINNTVTNNIVSFASQGTVTTNWPTQIISNTTGTLINTSVSLQIRATVILRVELSNDYDIYSLDFNTNNVNATLSTYNTNGTTSTITNWEEVFNGEWYQTNLGTGSCPVWEKAISLLSSTFTINGGTSTIKPLIYIEDFELPTVNSNEVAGCTKPNISFTTEAVVAYLNSPNCINLAQQFEIYDVKQTYDLNDYQGYVYYSYNTPVASTLCAEYTGLNSYPSIPSTTGGVNVTYFDHALNATILLPNSTLNDLQNEGLLMYVKVTTDKNLNTNTTSFYNNCQGMNLKLRVSLRYEVNRPANVSLNVTDLAPDNNTTWDWQNYLPAVTLGPIPNDFPSASPQLTTLEFNQISGPNYQNISGTVSCGNGGNFNYSSYGTYVWESGLFNLGTNDLGSLNLINLNSIYAFNILSTSIETPSGCPLELNWYVRADLINESNISCGDFIYLGESDCYEFQIKFNDGSLTQQVTQGVVNPINNCVIPPQ